MEKVRIEGKSTEEKQASVFNPGPLALFVASSCIIFVAEAFVMFLLFLLELPESFLIGIADATLLSFIVVPTLYFMLFKPMRNTIAQLDTSEELRMKLKEVDELKNDFISIASHELCTPATSIMGYTEMLLDDVEPDRRREFLEIVYDEAKSLERIIDDLDVVNRLDSGGRLQINPSENNLVETVLKVVDIYRMRIPDAEINLRLTEQPVVLAYDEIRIRQVLDNILSNAFKYSQGDSCQIDLVLERHDGNVVVCIQDNGVGMTPDELEQVYDKFFRAQTEKDTVGGLGLGMAIVKDIIEGHKGNIEIESERGSGTTVTIALPCMS